MLRGVTVVLRSARVLVSAPSAGYCELRYEPYHGVEQESIFSPPVLGDLPTEVKEEDTPSGFSMLHFKEMGMGSVVCAPNGWHLSEAQDPLPDHMYHSDFAPRWSISKEDVLNNEDILTGVVVRSFKHLIGAPHHVIESMEENLFGNARYHFQHCNEKGLPLDKEYLKEGHGIGHIFTGASDLGNRYRSVIEMNLYQRPLQPDDPKSPLRDFYMYTDIFYWKKERWIMSLNYQCPLEDAEKTKPILDTIRNRSIFNFTSPLYRVVYPQLFSVEPYPPSQ